MLYLAEEAGRRLCIRSVSTAQLVGGDFEGLETCPWCSAAISGHTKWEVTKEEEQKTDLNI